MRNFQDSDDPFIFIRKVFVGFGCSTIIMYYSRLIFIFHTLSLLLESYHVITNFSLDIITQYGSAMSLMLYSITSQFLLICEQNLITEVVEECKSFFWTMDFLSFIKQTQILKDMTKIKRKMYLSWIWFVVFGIALLPVWGDYNEMFLFPFIYQTYFGNWSPLFYYFHASSFPFLAYIAIRIPAFILYLTLALHFQTLLLNQKILQIPQNKSGNQEDIFRNLCSCISHHVALKKFVTKTQQSIQKMIPVYFVLAILCLVAVMYSCLNSLAMSTSNHFKVRGFFGGVCGVVVLYTFAEAGQLQADTTGEVFNTLMQCSWYNWNNRNQKILLLFMVNSLKPSYIDWGGVIVGYSFGSSVIKTCYSYALVLYKLKISKEQNVTF
ncbi:odorant receptor 175 [Tribolium castaneum]|uniref:Odorant receptor n=1 Tax=Tribolium castaneum TaxID=7070 RepID=D6WEN8_TRICA|nr:odorant receptor 175 [Tribolium castaneum]